jgi:hypothetical protein
MGNKNHRQLNNDSLNKIKILKTKNNEKLIAVIGATGHQGGAVVRALQANGQFKVRALSRNPVKHRDLADEVVEADLNRPDTLQPAFAGAHGTYLGSESRDRIALANKIAGRKPTKFSTWARLNVPVQTP